MAENKGNMQAAERAMGSTVTLAGTPVHRRLGQISHGKFTTEKH